MISRWRVVPPKALEERITSQKDASLETTENVRDSQKGVAATTALQERIIIWTVSSTVIVALVMTINIMMAMDHSFAYFPSAVEQIQEQVQQLIHKFQT